MFLPYFKTITFKTKLIKSKQNDTDNKMKFLLRIALLVLLATCSAFADKAQKLSEIPSITFKLSSKIIKLEKLSDFNATDIIANKDTLLVSDHRKIWAFKKGNSKLRELNISTEIPESAWFGPICANQKGFAIHFSDYPVPQHDEDSLKGRGAFIAAPSSKGFILTDNNLINQRHIKSLTITSRPPTKIGDYNKSTQFSDLVQSCMYYNNKLFIGAYGSLGKADLKNEAIELIDEDEEMTFNRHPIFVEKDAIWIEIDEGGLGGTSIEKRQHKNNKSSVFYIDNEYDIVSYSSFVRHNRQMIVGTTHGLFSLDEKTGCFTRFYLGQRISSMPTEHLIEQDGYLWAFIDGQWFQIDIEQHTAIKHVDADKNKFTNGVFFDGAWILIAPSGVWRYKPSQF